MRMRLEEHGFFGAFKEMASRGIGEVLPNTPPWLPELYHILAQGQMDELNPVQRAAGEVGSPILELGCGTGRLLIPLARLGYDVTGVERNPRMLEILAKKLESTPERVKQRIHVIESDMRDFKTETRFKLAFFSANTFLYLINVERQLETLRRIHEHLLPGGLLLVDVYRSRDGWGWDEPFIRTAYDRQSGEFVVYISQARHDPLCGASLLNAASILFPKNGEPKIWIQSWQEASLTPKETLLLLEKTGYEVLRMEGDYDGSPLELDSIQVVTVAKKPEG